MIYAANLKTNFTRTYTHKYIEELSSLHKKEDIYIFPTQSSLDNYKKGANLKIGAQNAYMCENGAFTGEIGVEQLDEFGITTLLLGHSERRNILKESDELIKEKFNYFKKLGYKIFFCIGENLDVKNKGLNETLKYNMGQLSGIDLDYKNLIIAYEPIWAIGTGVSAKTEDVDAIFNGLKKEFKTPLLYGGSVKSSNIKELSSITTLDGVLIGSAALKLDEFSKIINLGG